LAACAQRAAFAALAGRLTYPMMEMTRKFRHLF